MRKTQKIKTQKEPKTKDIHRANINHSPRSVRPGDQRDCTTESHRVSTTEVYTINPGGQNRATYEAEANRKNLTNEERQRNNPEMKGKGEVSETMLNEKEASHLSDTEFKAMFIESLMSSQSINKNYRETTMNSLQTITT